MASGISVWSELPWVLAGMQRGSSLRSHHMGGSLGSSRASIVSIQVSIDNERSHEQSAASAEDAGSEMIVASTRAGKRFLMEANPQSTARGSHRKEPPRRQRVRVGVKPRCKMCDNGRGESTEWLAASPPPVHGVNAVPNRSIPSAGAGFATSPGKPGISERSRLSSGWSRGSWVKARPT